jgi:hypothetical protein
MGCAGAPALLVALLQAAAADADLALRVEARPTTVATPEVPGTTTRTAASAAPTVTALGDAAGLRLTATYAPRLWTSDLDRSPSPLVDHAVEARVVSGLGGPRRLSLYAGGVRGRTDPLADPLRAALAGQAVQVVSTSPLRYESRRAGAGADLDFESTSTLSLAAEWADSRGLGPDASRLPVQQGPSLAGALTLAVTERDGVRISARAARVVTGEGTGRATADSGAAVLSWRRRLTPEVEGWLGGGAEVTHQDSLPRDQRTDHRPAAEAGVTRAGEDLRLGATSRVTSFVDRLTGETARAVDAAATAEWTASAALLLTARVSGATRVDGVTATVTGEVRAMWRWTEDLVLEAGVTALRQRERQAGHPSFGEVAGFVAATWARPRLFRQIAPPGG